MLLVVGTPAAPAPKAEDGVKLDPATQAKVRKLQMERRDVLKKALDARREEYKAGRGTMEALLEGTRNLLHAELDLASTTQERIAAHAAILKVMKEMEKLATAQYEAGRLKLADHCDMQAARMEAEIGWLKAGGGKEKKEK
jgi:outer membrane protein TolC